MQQLTGADYGSIFMERGNTFSHVAALVIYDPSSAPGGKVRFKDILAHFDRRLHRHPIFRRRLIAAPLGIDRPYWFEDPEIDVEFHIRHIALPHPGDWRQLMIQVARLHARPLDRSRPLWELYVVEGLDGIPGLPPGCFAMVFKFHHASVDGMAFLHLIEALHSAASDRDPPEEAVRTVYADRQPSTLDLAVHTVSHLAGRAVSLAKFSGAILGKVAGIGKEMLVQRLNPEQGTGHDEPIALPAIHRAPVTRFNHEISRHRVVDAVGLPLAAIKALRLKVPGVSINDIFLAVTGGALRKYLALKNELPARSLTALMPISLRTSGKGGGNDVSGVAVSLCSDIADPIDRLKGAHVASRRAIHDADLLGRDTTKKLVDVAPSFIGEFIMRHVLLPQLNTAVSNLRGPEATLYVAGARMMRFYPVSMPADYSGLNHTAVSYGDHLWVGIVACRAMLPDPAVYAQCFRDAFNETLAAAGLPRGDEPAFTNEPATGAAKIPARAATRSPARRKPAPKKSGGPAAT